MILTPQKAYLQFDFGSEYDFKLLFHLDAAPKNWNIKIVAHFYRFSIGDLTDMCEGDR